MYLIGIRYNRIEIWECHSGLHMVTLRSNDDYFPRIYSCSTDGSLLAICSGDGAKVTVWDLSALNACTELRLLSPPPPANIRSVCFVKNSDQLIIGYSDTIALYDARNGTLLHLNQMPICTNVFSRGAGDSIVALSLHGDVHEFGADLTFLRGDRVELGEFCSVILSGDSLVWSIQDHLQFFNLDTWTSTVKFDISSNVRWLRGNDDGSRILVCLNGPLNILALDVVNNSRLFDFVSYGGVCYSFDGSCIYGISAVGNLFCLDAESGTPMSCSFIQPEPAPWSFETLAVLSLAHVILM
jgi:WD40 repeat protein